MNLPKHQANALLKELGFSTIPIDPYSIASKLGIKVSEDNCDGYTGALIVVGGIALISIKKSIREYARKRFTIAHELGHFRIPGHLEEGMIGLKCTDKDLNTFWENNGKESQANSFAAELLMPKKQFLKRTKHKDLTFDLINDLTTEFETSLTATAYRYVELTDDYALIRSENGIIKSFFKGDGFPFYVRGYGQLSEESMAIEFFKGNELPRNWESVSADCWIDDFKIEDENDLIWRTVKMTKGKKYYVNIEGSEYPWDKPTITTEEVISLGGWDPSLGAILIDKDQNERTLQPKEVVELKPGMGFSKKVHFKRG